ncbi:MAG: hypothetical protein A3E31_00365 [Candidatus Rokubacteria bacterium RIFCSPHIGHO2_12_FULL_73_22]|nr:MAG: hypothetical protein A3E31_00365 [Candidatus Rokubacteria bacterium RIFCSPHIGHO2_12_FULL_73_22]
MWSGTHSRIAPAPRRSRTAWVAGAAGARYTRFAEGVVSTAWAAGPASTSIRSRSPPRTPPVGFRIETTAAGSSSATGASTCSGSV